MNLLSDLIIKCVSWIHLSVFMNYFDNPGGMIPSWLVNWAAKVSGLWDVLDLLHHQLSVWHHVTIVNVCRRASRRSSRTWRRPAATIPASARTTSDARLLYCCVWGQKGILGILGGVEGVSTVTCIWNPSVAFSLNPFLFHSGVAEWTDFGLICQMIEIIFNLM